MNMKKKSGSFNRKKIWVVRTSLPLVLKLNEMIETLREVKSLIQRITQFQATFTGEKKTR
jgi:hypothetical protein